MRLRISSTRLLAAVIVAGCGPLTEMARADSPTSTRILQEEHHLGGPRSPGTYYFEVATTFTDIALDGKMGETEVLRMRLRCVSPGGGGAEEDRYTCKWFSYTRPDGTEVTIPALEGWTYIFKKTPTDLDERGQVFGIDHEKFEQLTGSDGAALEPIKAYLVYNTFIDFHAFCDGFARPTSDGKGIQHLTRIGQRVVHSAAHSKPPTNLGAAVKKGSFFQNGETTLAFKGLSAVDNAPCAIVEFDSGHSTFEMLVEPMPALVVKTIGASRYVGDIHVDMETNWTRMVTMRESVVCETVVPIPGGQPPMKINAAQERQSIIRMIAKTEYQKK